MIAGINGGFSFSEATIVFFLSKIIHNVTKTYIIYIYNIIKVKETIIHSLNKKRDKFFTPQYTMVVTNYLREEWQRFLSSCCEETPCDTNFTPICIT